VKFNVPVGQLELGSVAMTCTAAELNLLDGVSGLVQADFTKLAAMTAAAADVNILLGCAGNGLVVADLTKLAGVDATAAELNYLDIDALAKTDLTKLAALDATAAELNLMDSGTTQATATLVAADGVVVNDADVGMKQCLVCDFSTYLALDSGGLQVSSSKLSVNNHARALALTFAIDYGMPTSVQNDKQWLDCGGVNTNKVRLPLGEAGDILNISVQLDQNTASNETYTVYVIGDDGESQTTLASAPIAGSQNYSGSVTIAAGFSQSQGIGVYIKRTDANAGACSYEGALMTMHYKLDDESE